MPASLVVDVLVVISLIGALAAGYSRGFLRTVGALAGGIVGAIAVYVVVPWVNVWAATVQWRVPLLLGVAVLLIGLGAMLGAAVGRLLRGGARKVKLGWFDRLSGAVAGLVVTTTVWLLVAATAAPLGAPWLSTTVAGSTVIRAIEGAIPDPVQSWLAEARSAIGDQGAPWLIDALDGPSTAPELPDVPTDDPDVAAAAASVVRVSGNAYACGVGVTGSGWVAAPDRVITNAHVIAGVTEPVIEAPGQFPVPGRVVYVDAVNDLAVIATDGLAVPALALDPSVSRGDTGIVAGYPFGGPMRLGAAEVLSADPVRLMIDGEARSRPVLTLAADVDQGNSGGPLLSDSGEVAGVVFGKGTSADRIAYAVPLSVVEPVVSEAPSLEAAVDPGACIR